MAVVQFRTLCLIIFTRFFATLIASSNRRTYIVHMDVSKVMESKSSRDWYASVLDSVTEVAAADNEQLMTMPPELLYTYNTAITGFAAVLSSKQYERLTRVDGFVSAVEDGIRHPQMTHSPRFLGLEPGKGLWNGSEIGSDIIVGVIDTGIWPEHESFNDFGLSEVPVRWTGSCEKGANFSELNCNKKLVGARYFLKAYEAICGGIDEKVEFRSARSADGHGTHTASTAAGSVVRGANLFGMAHGIARGISYRSRIAAYKACWEQGCADADITAAIDQALADGVDVLSISLVGDSIPYYRDSVLIAAFAASEKGVFVSFSAGNDGPTPSTVGNAAPWVTTVGASSLDRSFLSRVVLSNGRTFNGASINSGVTRKINNLPIVYGKTAGRKGAEFCISGSLSGKKAKGKIVLCQRGVNYRTEKGLAVKSAGGAAMLLFNSPEFGEELVADPHVLLAVALGASAGEEISSLLSANTSLTASISFLGTHYGARAPLVAAMSSRGPSIIDPHVIKPDIVAPGIDILSAWPPVGSITDLGSDKRRAEFNILSGTSMACPHISGVAALIKSVHRDWSPAAIKSAIMTSAQVHDNKGRLISDASTFKQNKLATPFGFGSGQMNPERASEPGLVYDITTEDYLQYACSINFTDAQVSVLARRKYRCINDRFHPGDLNYPSFAVVFDAGKTVKTGFTYKRSVTYVGKRKIVFEVTVIEPKGVEVIVKPKVLRFVKSGEKRSYNVSFIQSSKAGCRRGVSSFGSLIWSGGRYAVRSPIAVTWQ